MHLLVLLLLLVDLGDFPLHAVEVPLESQHRIVLPVAVGHAQLAAQDQVALLLALQLLPLTDPLLLRNHKKTVT
jgi:hypothetical protein